MADPRLTSWCFTHISTIRFVYICTLLPLHHRDAEPAQLGEEVRVLHRDSPVSCGHRWDAHPGQETLPEAAVRRLGPTDRGVQHRPQQRENRYVWRCWTSPVSGSGLHGNRCCPNFFFLQQPTLGDYSLITVSLYFWTYMTGIWKSVHFFLAFRKLPWQQHLYYS